jgi:hypothetical protein
MIENLKHGLTFLSMPYTDDSKEVVQERFEKSLKVSAHLMLHDVHLLSPIGFGHPIVISHPVPGDWSYWNNYCMKLILCSNQLIVFMLDGWKESKGVQAELSFARSIKLPIYFIDEDFNITQYEY